MSCDLLWFGTVVLLIVPFIAFWAPDFRGDAYIRRCEQNLGRLLLEIQTVENRWHAYSDHLKSFLTLLSWPFVVAAILAFLTSDKYDLKSTANQLGDIVDCGVPFAFLGFLAVGTLVVWMKPIPGEHLTIRKDGIWHRGCAIPIKQLHSVEFTHKGKLKFCWPHEVPSTRRQLIKCTIPSSFIKTVKDTLDPIIPEHARSWTPTDSSLL